MSCVGSPLAFNPTINVLRALQTFDTAKMQQSTGGLTIQTWHMVTSALFTTSYAICLSMEDGTDIHIIIKKIHGTKRKARDDIGSRPARRD
jgi:hypothetical protein